MFDFSDWTESQIRKTRVWQWDSASEVGTRLHTDFECLYQVTVDSDGASTCTLAECGQAETYDLSLLYATVSIISSCFKNERHASLSLG